MLSQQATLTMGQTILIYGSKGISTDGIDVFTDVSTAAVTCRMLMTAVSSNGLLIVHIHASVIASREETCIASQNETQTSLPPAIHRNARSQRELERRSWGGRVRVAGEDAGHTCHYSGWRPLK